jgi:peptidyl-prolyl cis-trans isomerase SurA
MKKKSIQWSLLGLWILMGSGFVFAAESNRIVAVVNNEIITNFELEKAMKSVPAETLENGNKEEIQKQILFQLIDAKVVDLQIKKLGIKISPEELDKAVSRIRQDEGFSNQKDFMTALAKDGLSEGEFRGKVKDQLLRYKLVSREIGSKIVINESDLRDYFQTHQSEFQNPEGVHLAQIILLIKEGSSPEEMEKQKIKAEEIWGRLKKGEDFSEMAKKFSQDSSAAQGGDLGVFKLDELDSILRKVISGLNPGEITPVIQSPNGFQIIKVVATQGGKHFTFDEVKERIQEKLFKDQVDQRFKRWLEEVKARSYIKILL